MFWNKEPAFLKSIASNLKDRGTRLIYADWLEERGDPRSKLIRMEEEIRRTPAYLDRYWELRRQRDQVQLKVPTTWLHSLGYGLERYPLFGNGIPDDWKSRWRLYIAFLDLWGKLPVQDVGHPCESVAKVEKVWGLSLPPVVKEWIGQIDLAASGSSRQSSFADEYLPRDLRQNFSKMPFLIISQMMHFTYFIRREDILSGCEDPPVYSLNEQAHRDRQTNPDAKSQLLKLHRDSLSNYALDSLSRVFCRCKNQFFAEIKDLDTAVKELKSGLPIHLKIGNTWIFEDDNAIVFITTFAGNSGMMEVRVADIVTSKTIQPILWDYCDIYGQGAFGIFEELPPIRRDKRPKA